MRFLEFSCFGTFLFIQSLVNYWGKHQMSKPDWRNHSSVVPTAGMSGSKVKCDWNSAQRVL